MRRLLLAALAAAALPFAAAATTIQLKDLPEMVSDAEQALQGRVLSARAVEQGTIIVTEYEIEVADWLKPGRSGRPRTITIIQPGGTVGDVTMTVEGAAHFSPGDELILFTRDYGGQGRQQVVNLMQGALPVVTERPAPGSSAPPRRRLPHASGFPGGAPEDLDAFKARVRELAAARP
jgi:hypothetical protein